MESTSQFLLNHTHGTLTSFKAHFITIVCSRPQHAR